MEGDTISFKNKKSLGVEIITDHSTPYSEDLHPDSVQGFITGMSESLAHDYVHVRGTNGHAVSVKCEINLTDVVMRSKDKGCRLFLNERMLPDPTE